MENQKENKKTSHFGFMLRNGAGAVLVAGTLGASIGAALCYSSPPRAYVEMISWRAEPIEVRMFRSLPINTELNTPKDIGCLLRGFTPKDVRCLLITNRKSNPVK